MDIEQNLFALIIWIWVDSLNQVQPETCFYTPRISFHFYYQAYLSSNSKNTLCPQGQYCSTTDLLHTLKVLATNL